MKKIGVLGGTFNPIHNGHLLLAETARQEWGLDEVLLIPSGCSYMKDPREILPGPVRLEMARLAAADNPYFRVSDLEIRRTGNSYTCDTIQELGQMFPDARLYHIVGADTLFHMEAWKEPERIFSGCITLAAVRDGGQDEKLLRQARHLMETYHTQVHLLPSLHLEISATDIRNRCRHGKSIRYLVPESVRLFLEENGYYRSK